MAGARDELSGVTLRVRRRGYRVQTLLLASADDDGGAFARKCFRDRESNTSASSSHDGDFTLELVHAWTSLFVYSMLASRSSRSRWAAISFGTGGSGGNGFPLSTSLRNRSNAQAGTLR